MPNPLEDIFKMCGSVGTTVTSVWGLIGKVQKRFGQIKDITERGGKQGAWFFLTYTVFQYVYAIGLVICGLASFGLLIGGVAKIIDPPDGIRYLTPFFESSTLEVLGVAVLVLLVALLNVLSWIAIVLVGWLPAWILPFKQTAAWYNLWQFSLPLSEPKPIFISPAGISALADIAISKLENNGGPSLNFAGTPATLSLDERANAALIGCLLEKEHSVRGWPKPNWAAFYDAVAAVEVNSRKLVSPTYLVSLPQGSDFYTIFTNEVNQRLPNGEPRIPDSAEARNDLSKAVEILVKKYKGSARNLAFRWYSKKPKLKLAFSRSQVFRPFDVSSMVPQFLNDDRPTRDRLRRKTLRNLERMCKFVPTDRLMPVVHGHSLGELERACDGITDVCPKVNKIGIGGFVPLICSGGLVRQFRYSRKDGTRGDRNTWISDALKLVRQRFPEAYLHVFGIGSATTAISVLSLGADSVDSFSWRRVANYGAILLPGCSERFPTARKDRVRSRPIISERELPLLANCGCPACAKVLNVQKRLRVLAACYRSRAVHNAWTVLSEVAELRSAIQRNRTQEFLMSRLSPVHRLYKAVSERWSLPFRG